VNARFRISGGVTERQTVTATGLVFPWRVSPDAGQVAAASDGIALAGTVALTWTLGPLSWPAPVYLVLAFIALHVVAPRRGRLEVSVAKDIGWVLQRLAAPLLVLVPIAGGAASELAVPAATAVVAVMLTRAVAYASLRWARSRGFVSEPCIVLGAGDVGLRLVNVLIGHAEFGLVPIGFLDGTTRTDLPVPVLGDPTDLDRVTRERGIRTVLIADGDVTDDETVRSIRATADRPLDLYVVPRLVEAGAVPSGADRLWGVHLLHVERAIFTGPSRVAKRTLDLLLASSALVVLSPVFLAAAVATRLSGPGPVLFRQKRVGINGVPFEMLKFRTMELGDDSDTTWSVSGDERVTRVGRLLRRASVDELPQLLNVLRGEMSLVGPRPERPHFVDRFAVAVPGYADRHRVLGGMTGLAQVHGRSTKFEGIPERARFDNDYIENWSFWGDVVILWRTVRLLFKGDQDAGPDGAGSD
jgi:exopolysaccharide biosynthesis polyprenyl glycosylphosphotransferase